MLLNALKKTTKPNRPAPKKKKFDKIVNPSDKTSEELISDATKTLQQFKALNERMNKFYDTVSPR
jgi:CRISPR/Cas system CSM-associated protein Csm2 small subunit